MYWVPSDSYTACLRRLLRLPTARWFIKADTDAVFNMVRLRLVLWRENDIKPQDDDIRLDSTPRPRLDYLGHAVRTFGFRGQQTWFDARRSFVYMQGGACAHSRRFERLRTRAWFSPHAALTHPPARGTLA